MDYYFVLFSENLDDIISMRNFSDNLERVDDVTIEKVNISKEQLDKSLLDYEQNKNTRFRKEKTAQHVVELKEIKHQFIQSVLMPRISDIQKSLDEHRSGKPQVTVTAQDVQDSYTNKLYRSNQDLATVVNRRKEINRLFDTKLGIDGKKEPQAKPNSFYDLKELYKWETVVKPRPVKPDHVESKPQVVLPDKKQEISLDQLIWKYSSCYSYYYTHFINQLCINKQ